ncbi:hypothetical protein GCK72_007119 [Caenorhabditis remanei]|uniref:BHLH domain-containing protein n=1 Tax=Caenorhabditis remanei TaxID=31234 RepID=A0A6A5HGL2_CAERE|nr:hypothetical protein GCK72_007119 [Caenorhabditis remanei]KAF1767160.1 hypothetical protein GCK72_007119 [Caenorhabditis remanei]
MPAVKTERKNGRGAGKATASSYEALKIAKQRKIAKRERERCATINKEFDALKGKIAFLTAGIPVKQLSKKMVLEIATEYITHLKKILRSPSFEPAGSSSTDDLVVDDHDYFGTTVKKLNY